MKNYIPIYFFIIYVTANLTLSYCQTSSDLPKPLWIGINYNLKADYWFTSDDDDSEKNVGHAFDYEPDFIPTNSYGVSLYYRGKFLFFYNDEIGFSFKESDQQKSLEETDKPSFIRKINTFLDLFFLTEIWKSNKFSWLNKLRILYKHHLFLGKAVIQEDTRFISFNNVTTELQSGDLIRFKSKFDEFCILYAKDENYRVGLYYNKTYKPHEAATQDTQVLETEITGIGVKFLRDYKSTVLDANLGLATFRAKKGSFSSTGFETLLHFEWKPEYYLIGNDTQKISSVQRLIISPLLGIRFSMQIGPTPSSESSDGTSELAMDIILDGGIKLQYIF